MSTEEFQKIVGKVTIFDTRLNVDGGLIKGTYWTPAQGALCNWISLMAKPEEPIAFVT